MLTLILAMIGYIVLLIFSGLLAMYVFDSVPSYSTMAWNGSWLIEVAFIIVTFTLLGIPLGIIKWFWVNFPEHKGY